METETKLLLSQKIRKICEDTGRTPVFIGIDGHCGAGKSTLGTYLHEQMGGNLFHMDDFFLRPEQRTDSRRKEPGGNVDYERFRTEVLDRIRNEKPVLYRKYNCRKGCLETGRTVAAEKLNIIEGAYCMHPYFQDPYDLKIFLAL